ncbi:MAG TPA: class I adenylate-forming enzyme family protein [Acidimicrobiales bacterium]|nr:class I adenylate-forming enzyme family protein [Acidimicrobiales bacterium]
MSSPVADPGGLADVVRAAAIRYGETPLYVMPDGTTLSYGGLDALSDTVSEALRRRGVCPGDVVALLLPSGPAYAVLYAALSKLGAICAGINDRLSPPERRACLEVAAPALVVGTGGLLVGTEPASVDAVGDVLAIPATGPGAEALGELCAGASASAHGVQPAAYDRLRPVAIVFTSGTTGAPRGAVFGGAQLDAISVADGGRRWGGGGRGLSSTSFAHLGYMTKLPQVLRSGGTSFVMERWSAGEALAMVERHRLTNLGGIPTQMALMLHHERFASTDLSSLQMVALGGGPATAALVRETRARLGVGVVTRYTCTEAGVGTGTNPDDPDEDAEVSVGRPRPGVTVTIRSDVRDADADADATVADGETGEVCLAGPATMKGYWRDPDAGAAVRTGDGAVRTGDLGYLDDGGRLHLAGRAKEMYVRGGYNVFPQEVEAVLEEHPLLSQVAVVPRTDPIMGEIGVAVVVARPGAPAPTLGDLREFAAARLARHKLPEALLAVEELPRTAMEKVDRRALAGLVGTAAPEQATATMPQRARRS